MSRRPRDSICFSSGVTRSPAVATARPMLPSAVAAPVAVTSARPDPATTVVPRYTMLTLSAKGVSAPTGSSGSLATGMLSPVSAASLTLSAALRMRRPSAGMWLPASRTMTSPGTTSAAGHTLKAPPIHERFGGGQRPQLRQGPACAPLGAKANGGVHQEGGKNGRRFKCSPMAMATPPPRAEAGRPDFETDAGRAARAGRRALRACGSVLRRQVALALRSGPILALDRSAGLPPLPQYPAHAKAWCYRFSVMVLSDSSDRRVDLSEFARTIREGETSSW